MAVWTLKRGDTNPQRFRLENGDLTPKDLTGSTVRKLLIGFANGTYASRDVTIQTPPGSDGYVVYAPLATDWNPGSGGAGTKASPFTVGGFYPSLPLEAEADREHTFEIEVVDSADVRTTYPNGRHHVLRTIDDLGDG